MAATTSRPPTTTTDGTAGPETSPGRRGFIHRFCPRYVASSVNQIDPDALAQRGIRAVILDLDNTLVAWHEETVGAEVAGWIEGLHSRGIAICIASNTHRPRRLRRLAEQVQVGWAPRVAKPRRAGFRRAMQQMSSQPEETAMIGDQLLTDIWGGNRCGLLTILVDQMTPHEFIGTRLVHRPVERWLLAQFRARGWLRAFTAGTEPEGANSAANP